VLLACIGLYGNTTLLPDADDVGAFLPQRITRPALFAYVESELRRESFARSKTNEYARADKAAVWIFGKSVPECAYIIRFPDE
jgi:hypothetical protein